MKVLVTGANGFVGKYLVNKLLSEGHIVIAAIRDTSSLLLDNNNLYRTKLDLFDRNCLVSMIRKYSPDAIFHLAAQSNISLSWDNPAETTNINVIGTLNLLEAISDTAPSTKIITVGSSEEYGITADNKKCLEEDDTCQPSNPYAVSKYTMGQLGLLIARKNNLSLIHVRPFNHFGPGQSINFVVSDFSYQIMKIEKRLSEPIIKVGNIDNKRDFTDVRDITNAYYNLLVSPVKTGIYNVCSGYSYSLRQILEILLNNSTIKNVEVITEIHKKRTNDIIEFYGSNSKISKAINWKPSIPLETSLKETLEWWHHNYKPE